jgi:hypothetical protein
LDADLQSANEYSFEEWPFVLPKKRRKPLSWLRCVLHVSAIGLAVGSLWVFFLGIDEIAEAVSNLGL